VLHYNYRVRVAFPTKVRPSSMRRTSILLDRRNLSERVDYIHAQRCEMPQIARQHR
jgi:hypothetical protein